VIYSSDGFPIAYFSIHAPTIIGDFPIDRFGQVASTTEYTGNIVRNHNDPQFFPVTPSLDEWIEQQKRLLDNAIDAYTAV
jgi:hypothetical protein